MQKLKNLLKESNKSIEGRREYHDAIFRELKLAKKEKNAEKIVFYTEAITKVSTVGFDKFKASDAYEPWKKAHAQDIHQAQKEINRFSHMNEALTKPPTKVTKAGGKVPSVNDTWDIPATSPAEHRAKVNSGKQHAIGPYDDMWENARADINNPIDEPSTGYIGRRKQNTGKQYAITAYDDQWENKIKEVRTMSVPDKHQLRIAYDTLKLSDEGAHIMGGMTKEEAKEVIKRLTGKSVKDESMKLQNLLKKPKNEYVSTPYKDRDKVVAVSPYSTKNETFTGVIERKIGTDIYVVKPDADSLTKLDRAQALRLKDGVKLMANQLKKRSSVDIKS